MEKNFMKREEKGYRMRSRFDEKNYNLCMEDEA